MMNERRTLTLLFLLSAFLLLSGIVWAQASANYRLPRQLFASAGGQMTSANYSLRSSMGQSSAIGASGGADYDLNAGYWRHQSLPPACPKPLSGVEISGPTTGYTGMPYAFTAAITPTDATTPVVYTWSSAGLVGGQGADTVTYTWSSTGEKSVQVTARNCGGQDFSDSRAVVINTPQGEGDDYEEDDACAQASAILTDGSIQEHTFHNVDDVDWVSFQAISGTEYLVEAVTPSDSGADVSLQLYDACGAVPTDTQDHSFSPDVRLRFTAPRDGQLYLRYSNHFPEVSGPDVTYQASVRALAESATPGALVLVAGRLRIGDDLQSNIHHVTNRVYNLFLSHGYDKERIYYLASDQSIDTDGNGFADDVDALARRDNLEMAITQWAASKVGPERAFTLYLMDHGGTDRFYLNGSTQTISPDDLNGCLDELEDTAPGVRVNVIMEACHSGSFVDTLSEEGRVVIASTAMHAVAYASDAGAEFSDAFLSGLGRGLSLYNSFEEARWAAETAHPDQTPWLDDDGDGIWDRSADGEEAARRGFAYKGTFPEEKWPPYVVWAQVAEVEDGDGVIEAEVRDDQAVNFVWAMVYKPSYTPPDPGETEEMPKLDLPTVQLQPQGNDLFSAIYEGFDEIGEYRLVIYAADGEGLEGRPKELTVQVGDGAFVDPEGATSIPISTAGYTSTVTIPAGAVTETTVISYASLATPTTAPAGFQFAGWGLDLRAYQKGQLLPRLDFLKPVTISIGYDGERVAEMGEETLRLYYRDEGTWSTEGLTVTARFPESDRLTAVVTHLSKFALFGEERGFEVYLPLVLRE
jgi:hypothetical protein